MINIFCGRIRTLQDKVVVRHGMLAAASKVEYQGAIYEISDALIFVSILLKNRTEIYQIQ